MISLLRLWESVAPLVLILRSSVRKISLFDYILGIQNIFVFLNTLFNRGVMIKNIKYLGRILMQDPDRFLSVLIFG